MRDRWADDEVEWQRYSEDGPVVAPRSDNDEALIASEEEVEEEEVAEKPEKNNGTSPRRERCALFDGCRSVDDFERLDKIDEGSYGVVYRARDTVSREVVALKRVKLTRESCVEGFPITALRETNVLLALTGNEHIVSVKEMVVGEDRDKVFMVMEYFDHDLKTCIEKHDGPFPQGDVKALMLQLLSALQFMHSRWFMHRDVKTSNLLYQNRTGRLALADFGLARRFGDPPPTHPPYTRNVVTLWYRAPELLLGATTYTGPDLDLWAAGCVFAELLLKKPLFQAKTELEQISQIFNVLGAPTEERWPGFELLPTAQAFQFKAHKRNRLRDTLPGTGFASTETTPLSESGLNLANHLLSLDPKQRASANDAIDHVYFKEAPLPTPRHQMPTFQLDRL